jgi:1,4-dihydroxy-6-naphthoate synthase
MNLSLGFSTCPNDTFMFDAMVNGRIDTEGLMFTTNLADIEHLNQGALSNLLDVTKVSFAVYPKISRHYQILDAGSALGFGNGPLLVSKHKIYPDEVSDIVIAIPGENTTANLLFSIAFPHIKEKKVLLFSDIENAVLSGEADAGLLIHENRFTYEEKGLKLIVDLGNWWEKQTNLPIPLGGIVVKRNLPSDLKFTINRVLSNSIAFAMEHPRTSSDFVKFHAQEMSEDVMQKHINLYVNNYSLNLGNDGRNAITQLFDRVRDIQNVVQFTEPIFAI